MGAANRRIAVVGLGYVGLPLAVALARKCDVVGFDISSARVTELSKGVDATGEVSEDALRRASISITNRSEDLRGSDVFIVTVPTPIDEANRPDLTALLGACELVGPQLSK